MPRDTELLNGRHSAQQIVEFATASYWAECSGSQHYRDFLHSKVHESFVRLAQDLGYRIEKIEPAPVAEPAAETEAA